LSGLFPCLIPRREYPNGTAGGPGGWGRQGSADRGDGEASRIITRLKAAFVRLGIRSFNPNLKAAAERLGTSRTPEGEPIPPAARCRSDAVDWDVDRSELAAVRPCGLPTFLSHRCMVSQITPASATAACIASS
jgi:hypothetical protein